jgi:integrase/recombinase XerD
MNNSSLLGPWIRRFLIEHLVGERNLAVNTQKSYRDMLVLLLPYLAAKVDKRIDRLTVDDLSPQMVRLFLTSMEGKRSIRHTLRNPALPGNVEVRNVTG